MYTDHHLSLWPTGDFRYKSLYSFDLDNTIETMAVHDLASKRLRRQRLLASDIYCHSTIYKPIRYRSYVTRPLLPRSISPIEFPRITLDRYRLPFCCKNCHRYDFSYLNVDNREPSFSPSAQNYYRLQTDYEKFRTRKHYSIKRINLKQRWRIYGFILIFYFILKKKLRQAKRQDTYYQHDYRRIRFFELSTAVHRVYLDPNSSIYQTLSYVIKTSTQLLNQDKLFHCVQTIIDQITNLLPKDGILGVNSEESVLIYLLNCSLEQYPSTYFWSIEKHLLSISYSKMKAHGILQIDHFTAKFLLLSTFIFRGLIKTLLLKPVKYRLTRGQLNQTQWLNIRLLSSLILYITRHAVIYKKQKNRLPMPFPFEMKHYLLDDEKLKKIFKNIEELIQSSAPKLSSWAYKYAERLQYYIKSGS